MMNPRNFKFQVEIMASHGFSFKVEFTSSLGLKKSYGSPFISINWYQSHSPVILFACQRNCILCMENVEAMLGDISTGNTAKDGAIAHLQQEQSHLLPQSITLRSSSNACCFSWMHHQPVPQFPSQTHQRCVGNGHHLPQHTACLRCSSQ